MNIFSKCFKNKKVIVTGHTGFKGSWLSLWLILNNAKVMGISNNVPTNPSHFNSIKLHKKITHKKIDIRNIKQVKKIFKSFKPDFVFHLAAQSLVNKSYKNPIETWQTNTIGTVNVLEALRNLKNSCVAVIITSDKCYKNLEITRGYKENDLLGGKDPYSASKASAELAIHSFVKSFYLSKKKNLKIGIARAGNVIGGGDWSDNRIVPDCMKAWSKSKSVNIRNPNSTRPWQHVLEALSGYLILAINLKNKKNLNGEAFNFGPSNNVEKKVKTLIQEMEKNLGKINIKNIKSNKYFESKLLKLNSNKAEKFLKWKCILSFSKTIKMTTLWYKNYYKKKEDFYKFSKNQILEYERELLRKN
jgi:CDP-glucose 4,6-dehydratase